MTPDVTVERTVQTPCGDLAVERPVRVADAATMVIYLYPADRHHPGGKLRLAYECAPLPFVVEQAGGAASTGTSAVLDTPFESIHQRVPFAAGSRDEVAMFERFIRDRR